MSEGGFYIKQEESMDSWLSVHLKPCPFCGRRISFIEIEFENGINKKLELRCNNCHADFIIEPDVYYGNDYAYMEEAPANIWNSRYTEADKVIDEAKKFCEEKEEQK